MMNNGSKFYSVDAPIREILNGGIRYRWDKRITRRYVMIYY